MPEEAIAKLRLARTEGVGPMTYQRLLARFSQVAEALRALPELARTGGRSTPLVVTPEHEAEREMAALTAIGGRLLFLGDRDYPHLLALLPDPPPVLSVLGDVAALAGKCVGLVGARNASANGQRIAEALAAELAGTGLVVVSGMARGIDAAAHAGALHLGRTVAAVAGGLDHPYPPEHADLQARIAAGGAVVSEAPLGTAPQSRNFPRRNRIIAGLSLGLVVVEAAMRSGSLITARLAQEANREIFAVPGSPLDPRCLGSNDLIRQGAHLTESAADVIGNLPELPDRDWSVFPQTGFTESGRRQGFAEPSWGSPTEDRDVGHARIELVRLLGPSPTALDDVLRSSHLPPSAIISALVQLELGLRVEMLPGNRIVLLA